MGNDEYRDRLLEEQLALSPEGRARLALVRGEREAQRMFKQVELRPAILVHAAAINPGAPVDLSEDARRRLDDDRDLVRLRQGNGFAERRFDGFRIERLDHPLPLVVEIRRPAYASILAFAFDFNAEEFRFIGSHFQAFHDLGRLVDSLFVGVRAGLIVRGEVLSTNVVRLLRSQHGEEAWLEPPLRFPELVVPGPGAVGSLMSDYTLGVALGLGLTGDPTVKP